MTNQLIDIYNDYVNFAITGGIEGFHNDNLHRQQWLQRSRHHDSSEFSVYVSLGLSVL